MTIVKTLGAVFAATAIAFGAAPAASALDFGSLSAFTPQATLTPAAFTPSGEPTAPGRYIQPSDCHGTPAPGDVWVPAHESGCEDAPNVVTLIVEPNGARSAISYANAIN